MAFSVVNVLSAVRLYCSSIPVVPLPAVRWSNAEVTVTFVTATLARSQPSERQLPDVGSMPPEHPVEKVEVR